MKKMGMLKNYNKMGEYEIEKGFASYKTLMEYYVGDMVLCNNIIDVDCSVLDNMTNGYNEEVGDFIEIYQYFLCNLGDWQRERLEKMGVILSYSDKLDCDVICVDHFGTSWDYVLTDVKLFDNIEDMEKWENEK